MQMITNCGRNRDSSNRTPFDECYMSNPVHHRTPWHSVARQVDFHARTVAFVVPSAWNALPLDNPMACSLTSSRSLLTCHLSGRLSLLTLHKHHTYIYPLPWSSIIFLHSACHPWFIYWPPSLSKERLCQFCPVTNSSNSAQVYGRCSENICWRTVWSQATHIANMHRYPARRAPAPL